MKSPTPFIVIVVDASGQLFRAVVLKRFERRLVYPSASKRQARRIVGAQANEFYKRQRAFHCRQREEDWKVQRYLNDWVSSPKGLISRRAILRSDRCFSWMGNQRSTNPDSHGGLRFTRTHKMFRDAWAENWSKIKNGLDRSLEEAKDANHPKRHHRYRLGAAVRQDRVPRVYQG